MYIPGFPGYHGQKHNLSNSLFAPYYCTIMGFHYPGQLQRTRNNTLYGQIIQNSRIMSQERVDVGDFLFGHRALVSKKGKLYSDCRAHQGLQDSPLPYAHQMPCWPTKCKILSETRHFFVVFHQLEPHCGQPSMVKQL
jgi:hypothetical protein